MDDTRAMRLVERPRDLDGMPQRLLERQRATRQASASVSPSRISITRKATSPSRPMSCSVQMCG